MKRFGEVQYEGFVEMKKGPYILYKDVEKLLKEAEKYLRYYGAGSYAENIADNIKEFLE